MPQSPDWNKYLDAGAEFVAMTRAQARRRAKELVGQGQLAQEQVQTFVDDLVDESRRRTDLMLDVLRKEVQRQVKTLGIATKEDLARLEARLAKQAGKPAAKSTPRAATTSAAKKKAKPKAKSKTSSNGSGKSAKKGLAKAAKKRAKKSVKKSAKTPAKKRATSKAGS